MEIYCDTLIAGIPGYGLATAQECFEICYNDPNCVLWTHAGSICYLTSNAADNQGEIELEGWTGGIKGRC
jgi:hypothetical protein